ncbi:MAG TPA: LuxR C-terminal-related transcriptional regulator [Gaiellaceae bacterium]|jgi:ATP/maltotriose-dependent transcriptional regulator MalT
MGGITPEALERARDAYARRAWLEAHEAFRRADEVAALEAEDLELLTTATLMLGRDDDALAVLERAHHRYLERGETLRAVRAAIWMGINLAYRGAVGPASGWLGRAQRLLDQEPGESAERGFLLIPLVFRHEAEGDYEAAAAVAGEAAAIGERFGDRDLFSISLHAQGHMLVRAGRSQEGFALLDEAMVTATTGDLSPFVVGIVYCGVIMACQEAFEVGRAREWTLALSEWADRQPELVAFTGRCRVHRAEILQLNGAWPDALEEAHRACVRLVETNNPAAGVAYYRHAELLRLRGDFAAAEEAYREASRFGWEPQPGLAQLRLAQGKCDAALAAIRRASAEIAEPLKRAALLPAHVEIALDAGELDEARTVCRELEELAGRYESAMLSGIVAHARGAVALAGGEPQAALLALREAQQIWLDLDAPYEVARSRALAAQGCAALGDTEAAALELEAACAVFRQLGAAPDLARIEARPGERHGLSSRELEVLRLVAAGKSNREIAAELVISEHTVARHVQNIYAKLRLSSRAAATAFAFEHDLV